jgi:hypothetical protein
LGQREIVTQQDTIIQIPDSVEMRRKLQDSIRLQRAPAASTSPVVKRDTVASLTYLTPGDFYSPDEVLSDSLNARFHQYNPAHQGPYPMGTLGNLGSPARHLFFEISKPKGTHPGHFAFELYKSEFRSFRFYDTDVALSRLYYSQGISQEDGLFNAQFGKNFDNGINFSINYQRINQDGIYSGQRAKHTAFGTGILYRSPGGRLDGIYHYQSNSIIQQENGGVDTASLNSLPPLISNSVAVILGEGQTFPLSTHRGRNLTVQHHIHLINPQKDNVQRKAAVDLIHTLEIGSTLIKYADNTLNTSEPEYYDQFVTDDRGIRNFVAVNTFDTGLDLQFRYRASSPDVTEQLLRVGLEFRNNKINQEPLEYDRQEIFLNASGQLGISPRISLDGTGYLGLFDANGMYFLSANARIELFKDAETWVNLERYQRIPTLVEARMFVNQVELWRTDFKNVSLSSLQFYYVHPSLKLSLYAGTHVLANGIFFGADRFPVQLDQTAEILQLSASKEILVLGHLGLNAQVMWQQYDADILALPQFIVKGQLFYTGRWFKQRLLVRAGIDLLVTDDYDGVSYFPVTGQFTYEPASQIGAYPAMDVFFSMQVKDAFKAFFKLENFTSYFRDDHFFQMGRMRCV